ncbi:MAG: hypothetical protein WCJ56_12325, partial [bacterium]
MKSFASQFIIAVACMGALLTAALPTVSIPLAPWSPLRNQPTSRYAISPTNSTARSVGAHVLGRAVPTSGPIRVLAIPVEFATDTVATTSGTGKFPYKTWGPAAEPGYLKNRLVALSQYYSEVSGQKIKLVGYNDPNSPDLAAKVTLTDTMTSYSADQSTLITDASRITRMITDIVKLTPSVLYSQYDVVMIIHAGSAAEISLDATTTDLRSQFIQVPYDQSVQTQDGSYISGWVQVPETMCCDSFIKAANPGIFDGTTPQIDFTKFELDPIVYKDSNVFVPHFWDVLGAWSYSMGQALGMQNV